MNPTQKTITQTIAKAALKTALQSFVAVLALLLVPVLTDWATTVGGGGEIDVNIDFFTKVLIAATGAAIASLISFVQNALRTPAGTDK